MSFINFLQKNKKHIKCTKRTNITKIILIIVLLIQVLVTSKIYSLNQQKNDNTYNAKQTLTETETTILNNIARVEMRHALKDINDRWNIYINQNNVNLLQTVNGNIKYKSLSNNEIIAPNQNEILKLINPVNNTITIKDINTHEILMKDARPMWDYSLIHKVVSEVAIPNHILSTHNNFIIMDTNTHEIIYSNNDEINEILARTKTSFTLDKIYETLNTINKIANNKAFNDLIKISNSDNITNITSDFTDTELFTDINDFTKYPLFKYNRIFQEKIILPYESIGFSGEPMQLTIIVSISEQQLANIFAKSLYNHIDIMNKYISIIDLYNIVSISNVCIIMILTVIVLYEVKCIKWSFKKNINNNDKNNL